MNGAEIERRLAGERVYHNRYDILTTTIGPDGLEDVSPDYRHFTESARAILYLVGGRDVSPGILTAAVVRLEACLETEAVAVAILAEEWRASRH